MKIAKSLLKESKDPMRALLQWRNTSISSVHCSPVPRLMLRRTQATEPQAEHLTRPPVQNPNQTKKHNTRKQRISQHYYNRNARDLSPVRKGTPVFVQSLKKYDPVKWSRGTVADNCSDRSYIVKTHGVSYTGNAEGTVGREGRNTTS